MIRNPLYLQKDFMLIALKWGFTHMRRFSAYYAELFEEYPSQTLKTPYSKDENIEGVCLQTGRDDRVNNW